MLYGNSHDGIGFREEMGEAKHMLRDKRISDNQNGKADVPANLHLRFRFRVRPYFFRSKNEAKRFCSYLR